MQPYCGQGNEHVAFSNRVAVDDLIALDQANDTACQIIFTWRIKSWHLGSFATQQRAARCAAAFRDAAHNGCHLLRTHLAHSQIIQKKERSRSAGKNIVDTMRDQISAYSVMATKRKRNLELRSHAIH